MMNTASASARGTTRPSLSAAAQNSAGLTRPSPSPCCAQMPSKALFRTSWGRWCTLRRPRAAVRSAATTDAATTAVSGGGGKSRDESGCAGRGMAARPQRGARICIHNGQLTNGSPNNSLTLRPKRGSSGNTQNDVYPCNLSEIGTFDTSDSTRYVARSGPIRDS